MCLRDLLLPAAEWLQVLVGIGIATSIAMWMFSIIRMGWHLGLRRWLALGANGIAMINVAFSTGPAKAEERGHVRTIFRWFGMIALGMIAMLISGGLIALVQRMSPCT